MFTTGNMARLYIWSMWNQSAGPRGVWSLELTLTHVKGRTESSQNKGGKDEGINTWLKPPQTELWYLFISYLSMITVVSFMASLHPRLCVIACATQLHLHVCVCVCVHINIHVWYRHECVHLRENYFVSRERSSCGRRHAQTLSNHSVMSVFNTVIMPRFKDFPVSSESARRIQELRSLIVNATLEDHIWTSA